MKTKKYICKLLLIQHGMAMGIDYELIKVRGASIIHPLTLTMEESCRCTLPMRKFHVLAGCKNAEWNPILKKCIYALKYWNGP